MSRSVMWVAALAVALMALVGCKTESFCFENCDPFAATGGSGGGGQYLGGAGGNFNFAGSGTDGGRCVGFNCPGEGGAGSGQCVPTNEGIEICDDIDNDCDGQTDNGIDFTLVRSCGSCDLDCTLTLTRVATPTCDTSTTPPSCDYDNCAPDWFDADGNRGNGCEYFCQWNPDRTNTTDPGGAEGCGRDDDCDDEIDEDVDTCGDVDNCGECGKRCSLPNATAMCVTDAAPGEDCTIDNTRCEIGTCADGWFDVDGNPGNGCEYECALSNGGAETCDGEDNDCDGLIDNTDPSLEDDSAIGAPCYGSDKGACAAAAVAGVQKCIAGTITCCDVDSNTKNSENDPRLPNASVRNGVCEGTVGPFVLYPDERDEVCNGVDDDCDGVTDDTPTDAGGICGSAVGECQTGTEQCIGGALTCVGNVGPTTDACDGLDNDCDGVIDGVRVPGGGAACSSNADCATQGRNALCLPVFTNNNLRECVARPTDTANASGGALACDVPPPPPSGVPQPCSGGTLSCFGGVKTCVGSVKAPPGTIDECGEDTNCDGQLTNQVGRLDPDVNNCGSCGNDCTAAAGNGNWICANGQCTPSGCEPGYVDCSSPPAPTNDCETACSPDPGGELCDGIDNDCDCQTDEGIPPPTVYQACGVSPAATDAGCTTGVAIACSAGGWICTFPPGYCPGGNCAAAVERCDGLDNDCDGEIDENFQPPLLNSGFLGASCKSDDGLPPPGHGDCQTTGVYVCSANGLGTTCAAQIDLTRATPELCDSVDNDCDGLVDAADPDMTAADGRLSQPCQGGTQGVCAAPGNAGLTQCAADGSVVCNGANVIRPGTVSEVCNSLDDDCDGLTDEVSDLIDDGGSCGTGTGACVAGTWQCQSGSLQCVGQIGPTAETCNGIDDDCDGTPDDNLTLGSCNVPPAAPGGATQPCSAGTFQCQSGALVCVGSVTAPSPVDLCGDDTNCDGQLSNQPNLQTDPRNCGTCGYDCAAQNAAAHGTWDCVAGGCVRTGCEFGYINCDGNANDCENYCPFQSGEEICNGLDDDCDCSTDEGIPLGQTPSPVSVCGVASGATQAECQPGDGTTGVAVVCNGGSWTCDFPTGFCTTVDPTSGQPSCALTPESCNSQDDNCNGAVDEDFKAPVRSTKILNSACSSEDLYRDLQCATSGNGSCPPSAPPHGVCAGTGTYVCNGTNDDTVCTATFINGNRSDELCDGLDNDCDGLADETFNSPGGDPRYVSPDVVQVGASLWVYQYEASRPKASTTNPGNGNGYWCTGGSCSGVPPAPAGKPLQKTPACSVPDVLPWFNVTPIEVEQTCQAMGGFICDQSVWNAACEAQSNCTYAYGPRASCNLASSPSSRVCNIHSFDFDNNGANGLTDGLLPTASGLLADCYGDWDGLQGNVSPGGRIFDLMGNLREITQLNSTTYTLMGGAFNTTVEGGASCDFDFFAVTASFQLFDTGFRCCFSQDPR